AQGINHGILSYSPRLAADAARVDLQRDLAHHLSRSRIFPRASRAPSVCGVHGRNRRGSAVSAGRAARTGARHAEHARLSGCAGPELRYFARRADSPAVEGRLALDAAERPGDDRAQGPERAGAVATRGIREPAGWQGTGDERAACA